MAYGAKKELLILFKSKGVGNVIKDANKLNGSLSHLKKQGNVLIHTNYKWQKGLKNVSKTMRILDSNIKQFPGHLLSIMFAGMAIQRVMSRVWRSTTNAFVQIMQSAGNTGTALNKLNLYWEYFKFVVGSALNKALQPLLPWIIKIINGFAKFIAQHPAGVFWGIVGALTVSKFLTAIGQIGLFFYGLSVWKPSANLVKWFGKGGLISGLGKLAGIGIGVYFAKETLDDLRKGAYIDAAFNALISGISFAYLLGKIGGKTALLFGIGAYFLKESYDSFKKGKIVDTIANLLIASSTFLLTKVPIAGGIVLALGLTLRFLIPPKWKEQIGGFLTKVYNYLLHPKQVISGKFDQTAVQPETEEINKSIQELSTVSTPEAIETMQKMYDQGIIPKLSNNLNKNLIPSWKSLTSEINNNITTLDNLKNSIKDEITPSWDNFNSKLSFAITNLDKLKGKIDQIPNESHKYIFIHVKRIEEAA